MVIRESLEALVKASENLRSGPLIVSRLEYTEAQQLVASVHKITGRRIALVMDQWDETRDLELQRNLLRDVLREPKQWEGCHILLGVQEGSEAANLLRDLETRHPGGARVYTLEGMHLQDGTERQRLLAFLHAQPKLRAIENVEDSRVLNLIGGNPCVTSWWLAEDGHVTPRTFDELERLAKEANDLRYSDLEKVLLALDGDRRKLAVRLALVPLTEDADAWHALRPTVLADLDPDALDDLKLANVLDQRAEAPKFGHSTRRDAARSFLDRRRREPVRTQAEGLIPALAKSVVEIGPSAVPYLIALVGLLDVARQQKLGPLPLALCEASSSVLGARLPSSELLDRGRPAGRKVARIRTGARSRRGAL